MLLIPLTVTVSSLTILQYFPLLFRKQFIDCEFTGVVIDKCQQTGFIKLSLPKLQHHVAQITGNF